MPMDRERILPPRRLRTALARFVQDTYIQVAREMHTRRPQPILIRLGEMWRKLTPEEREPFMQRERYDRARYEKAKIEWTRQHAGRPMGYMNRKRKKPNTPRRPATAYTIFKREMGDRLREEMPDATAREREREVIRGRWRDLDNEQRQKYKEKSDADKVRFANEMFELRKRERERERDLKRQQQDSAVEYAAAVPAPQEAPPPAPGADNAPAPVN